MSEQPELPQHALNEQEYQEEREAERQRQLSERTPEDWDVSADPGGLHD